MLEACLPCLGQQSHKQQHAESGHLHLQSYAVGPAELRRNTLQAVHMKVDTTAACSKLHVSHTKVQSWVTLSCTHLI